MNENELKKFSKANLGCGFDRREGFLNVDLNDFHSPDLVCDVTALTPIADAQFEYVLANDVLEHISRHRTHNTLREWNRVLRLGGVLQLQVPDVIGLMRLLLQPGNQTPAAQDGLLRCLFGTQSYPGDFHYTGFTELTLREALHRCGFELTQLRARDEWMFVASARKVGECRVDPLYRMPGDAAFVDAAYRRVLRRPADEGGGRHHLASLAAGIPREAVVDALFRSDEFRATGRVPEASL